MFRIQTYIGLFILPLCIVAGDKQCDTSALDFVNSACSETELCDEKTNSCQCLPGYDRKNSTYCVLKSSTLTESNSNYSSLVDNKGSGSLVAGILIPLVLIIFVICAIYVNRKYQIVSWVRSKMNRRNENYDELMIGQDIDDDDPPLH